MMTQKVFVNRTLNLKKIQYIGFDMDHTLIRYKTWEFERLTHQNVLKKLVENYKYPSSILSLPFDPDRIIRGLIIDRKAGNLLKLNRFSGIRISYHGTKKIDFAAQKAQYKSIYIDLSDPNYLAIDTAFSVSLALLFAQLVDLKETTEKDTLPNFDKISFDIENSVDTAHRDGTLKDEVTRNLDRYIVKDPQLVENLERFRKHDKKLFILTNSDYKYTQTLLDFAINPFLKEHKDWRELFNIVITFAKKPRFFYDKQSFMKIDPATGSMTNYDAPLTAGIYQGGCASMVTESLKLSGEDILYIGDHIYGDILRLKKDCNWRTALVVEELDHEIECIRKTRPLEKQINSLMTQKLPLEDEILRMTTAHKEKGSPLDEKKLTELQTKISAIDRNISDLITQSQAHFNKYWGETMRVGAEESYFAYQIERFACIYMGKLNDLLECSPRTYFRAFRKPQPHEVEDSV